MTDIHAIISIVAALVASIDASASRVKFNKRVCKKLARKCEWVEELLKNGKLGSPSNPALKALQGLLRNCDEDLKKFAGTGVLFRRLRSGGIPDICKLHIDELDEWIAVIMDSRFDGEDDADEDEDKDEDEADQKDVMRHVVLASRNVDDAKGVMLSKPIPPRLEKRATVDPNNLGDERREVGTFPFGTIYQGAYKGEAVYIRELKIDPEDKEAASKSIKASIMLAQCLSDCDNIVRIYGYCGAQTIVTAMPANGPLSEYTGKISTIQKVVIARQVADALVFMHDISAEGKYVVHRDIRAANVLLTDELKPMLTGFEVCKEGGLRTSHNHAAEDKLKRWRSPETKSGFGTSPESDVYSFGILMYEISTGKEPEDEVDLCEIEESRISEEYTALMKKCLQKHINARPKIDQVVDELYSIESSLGCT